VLLNEKPNDDHEIINRRVHAARQLPAWLTSDVGQKGAVFQMAKKKNKNFRTEIYFVGGKMKKRKIPLIDGMEVHEFIRRNADDAFLIENGYYEVLHEREMQRSRTSEWEAEVKKGSGVAPSLPPANHSDDLPF
jgi:hypothetical protein